MVFDWNVPKWEINSPEIDFSYPLVLNSVILLHRLDLLKMSYLHSLFQNLFKGTLEAQEV